MPAGQGGNKAQRELSPSASEFFSYAAGLRMRTADFDYHLPGELIASEPPAERGTSRMLVVDRASRSITDALFTSLPALLSPDDLLVLNDTRVVPARFFSNDGRKELLWLADAGERRWRCMVRPGRKMRPGDRIEIGSCTGIVLEIVEPGDRIIEFDQLPDKHRQGHLALPHYMGREEKPQLDRERYQTVFAREEGSVAAPTAGLHFTPELLASLPHEFITLHVGPGTFQPLRVENPDDHVMHTEPYEIAPAAARRIAAAKRVVAVGTTVTRVLEHVALTHDGIVPGHGSTNIFIRPGHEFRRVDCLLTNFHLPQSTLLMLVSAFADRDLILAAYQHAIQQRYRFYSYGDCMFIR